MNDVTIQVLSGGLNRRNAVADSVSGLVVGGVAVSPGGVQLNTPYKLSEIGDAEALGIQQGYDDAMVIHVYEHIKEFFRMCPNGTLWLLVCAQTVTLSQMIAQPTSPAVTLLNAANGEISQLGIYYNNPTPPSTFDMSTVVPAAQLLADDYFLHHQPNCILIGGNNFDYTSIDDLGSLASKNVSVVVGGHTEIVNNEYAMLGTALGTVALSRVNECIGWVQKFNIAGSNVQIPTISGVPYNNIGASVREEMQTKAYIFPITHIGKSGIYFNDSRTCTDKDSDYAFIENVRTINKAAKLTREALLPFLNSPVTVDAEGKLSQEVVKSYENAIRKLIDEQMARNQEVSSFDVYVDPNQDILSTSQLDVKLTIVPTGTSRNIIVKLGFENPFN